MRAPPVNNNGKYVVLILGFGAALAALFAFKTCGSHPSSNPQPVAAPSTSAAPSSTLQVDDIPLVPEIVDAASPSTTGKPTTAGNPCEVKSCNGQTTSELESALAFRAKQAHRCYDSALAQDSTLQGKIEIQLRVASNGTVCSAAVASNTMSSSNVATCVENSFRAAGHFPPPKGGCVDAKVPISFIPSQR